jgi:glycosidase
MAAFGSCHFFFNLSLMRSLFYAVFLAVAIAACTPDKENSRPEKHMSNTSHKLVIYQMMTRLFGNKVTTNKLYGTIHENGVGKFNDIDSAALEGIRELGTTHVWYTGVLEHATMTDYTNAGIASDDADVVKGRAGSPYAIKDYYDVNPDLAVNVRERMREFEDLIARTHRHGLKVIIDFVPNHVARGYRSDALPAGVKDLGEEDDVTSGFHPNNNFYYLPGESFRPPSQSEATSFPHPTRDGQFQENPAKATGNDQFTASPPLDSWFETVKLNYGVDIQGNRATYFDPVPNTWLKMRDIMAFWAKKNIDGFRCDMAEMVPVEFWEWVIPQIKNVNTEIIFIAEIYNPEQYRNFITRGKFDYLYDKVLLYDTLRALLGSNGSTAGIHAIQKKLEGINHNMLHFLENHDEQRIASRFFAGGPWRALPAFVLSATIDKGPIMIYFGQEVGEPGLGREGFQDDDGRTTIFDYWGVPEHQKWMNDGKFDGGRLSDEQRQLRRSYVELLTFASGSQAISSGDYIDITEANQAAGNFSERIHAFVRFTEDEKLLIVNGLNDKELDIRVQIPGDVCVRMGLDTTALYIARDMLWREVEVGFDSDFSFSLKMKPFSSFIFKIK